MTGVSVMLEVNRQRYSFKACYIMTELYQQQFAESETKIYCAGACQGSYYPVYDLHGHPEIT